jgi:hypothetical protein
LLGHILTDREDTWESVQSLFLIFTKLAVHLFSVHLLDGFLSCFKGLELDKAISTRFVICVDRDLDRCYAAKAREGIM